VVLFGCQNQHLALQYVLRNDPSMIFEVDVKSVHLYTVESLCQHLENRLLFETWDAVHAFGVFKTKTRTLPACQNYNTDFPLSNQVFTNIFQLWILWGAKIGFFLDHLVFKWFDDMMCRHVFIRVLYIVLEQIINFNRIEIWTLRNKICFLIVIKIIPTAEYMALTCLFEPLLNFKITYPIFNITAFVICPRVHWTHLSSHLFNFILINHNENGFTNQNYSKRLSRFSKSWILSRKIFKS